VSARLAVRSILLVASMLPFARSASAQRLGASATIAVSARVLPVASFEGGATHDFSALLEPGVARRIEPAHGARTRMTYNATTKVVASGTTLRGPGGVTVTPRFLCAIGGSGAPIADNAFDCDAGYVAPIEGGRATTVSLAVGAEIDASASRNVPAGLYVGQVTFVATNPGY
jgi:hypothetical protein